MQGLLARVGRGGFEAALLEVVFEQANQVAFVVDDQDLLSRSHSHRCRGSGARVQLATASDYLAPAAGSAWAPAPSSRTASERA